MTSSSSSLTQVLLDLRTGEITKDKGYERLFAAAYEELRHLATGLMRSQSSGHTLQPTALVNEAYLKLFEVDSLDWEDRAHFMAIAARAMRQILVSHARARSAAKRGGGWERLTLNESIDGKEDSFFEILTIDQSIGRLSALHERSARVVELRVFGGMNLDEIAHSLVVSRRTIDNDWAFARKWLSRELAES